MLVARRMVAAARVFSYVSGANRRARGDGWEPNGSAILRTKATSVISVDDQSFAHPGDQVV